MSSKLTKLVMGAAVIALAPATAAFADGTQAGTSIENVFTLNYEVNGVAQPPVDNSGDPTKFTVDRKIDVLVASQGNATAAPGETGVEQTFTVTNQGNDTQDLILTPAQVGAGDDFDTTNLTFVVYREDPANPGQPDLTNPITDTNGAYGDIAPDETVFVVVTSDVDAGETDNTTAQITLLAQVADKDTGVAVVEDSDGNTQDGVAENVFVDDQGVVDGNTDGQHSDVSTITVTAAAITAVKDVTLLGLTANDADCDTGTFIADPDTGDAIDPNDYYLPGACVQYTITVTNTGGTAATNVVLEDTLDQNLTYITSSDDMGGAYTGSSTVGGTTYNGGRPGTVQDCGATPCEIVMITGTVAAGSNATPTEGVLTIRARVN